MNTRADTRTGECEETTVDEAAVARVRTAVFDEHRNKTMAEMFSALGDATRLRIIEALAIEELCVCDLAAATGASQSAVSHQLRTLRALDLVAFRRDGKRAVYRLADEHVRSLLAQGAEHADERIGRRYRP